MEALFFVLNILLKLFPNERNVQQLIQREFKFLPVKFNY